MRSSLSRVATTIVVGLLVVACASSATPAPATTPPPTSSPPTSSPRATTSSPSPTTAATTSSSPPTSPPSGVNAVAAGGSHSCALTRVGGVKCWGSNDYGQLGNGTTTSRSVPVDVSGLASGVIAVAAGAWHTCALTSGGGVKCWGENSYGQLGNGRTTDGWVPVDVVGLASDVSAIAVGGTHTCALTSGGGVRCWGDNWNGALGNGTTTHSSSPVQVSGLASSVSAVAAGLGHTCALSTGGGVKCWGFSYRGERSNGQDSSVPVDISGLANGISAIAAGGNQTCALVSGGVAKCWGSGTMSNVPSDVPGLAGGVTAIALGQQHTCALASDGGIKCWGVNAAGQLGHGRPCDRYSAVPVDVETTPPSSTGTVTRTPIGSIEHATSPTDVVLRFDSVPTGGFLEVTGEMFMSGPEFTLYGDGTVIFRNERAQPPPAEGPIIRARPFMIAHLDEGQIQALLSFALEEGGLWDACEMNPGQLDLAGSWSFTIRTGSLEKRVEGVPGGPLDALADHLRNFDREGGVQTQVWVPDRFWGNLRDAGSAIDSGLLPDPHDAEVRPWPWPSIASREFVVGLTDLGGGRRVMSADEAAVLGLSDYGGVVQRIYLLGPDGVRIYYFSLWPLLPDETAGS
jgi:alpha-tubulin suppressor-like RCC1 family protein